MKIDDPFFFFSPYRETYRCCSKDRGREIKKKSLSFFLFYPSLSIPVAFSTVGSLSLSLSIFFYLSSGISLGATHLSMQCHMSKNWPVQWASALPSILLEQA